MGFADGWICGYISGWMDEARGFFFFLAYFLLTVYVRII